MNLFNPRPSETRSLLPRCQQLCIQSCQPAIAAIPLVYTCTTHKHTGKCTQSTNLCESWNSWNCDFMEASGALHHACWIAKLLYAIKIVMLSFKIRNELPRGAVFASGQVEKLERFVMFVLLVYVPWWISCTCAADENCLKMNSSVKRHKEHSRTICGACRRNWFLWHCFLHVCLHHRKMNWQLVWKLLTKLNQLRFPREQVLGLATQFPWQCITLNHPGWPHRTRFLGDLRNFKWTPTSWRETQLKNGQKMLIIWLLSKLSNIWGW